MSFCYFHGILPVCNGLRKQSVRANGTTVWHAVYDSMFFTESGTDLQGTVRTFAPASMSIHPTYSLILMHGKFVFPFVVDGSVTQDFAIESLHYEPFVADPSEPMYDVFLPPNMVPSITLLGFVVGAIVYMDDGAKAIDVKISNYMQNKTMECIIRCRFSLSPRWSKLNMPVAGSVVSIFGRPYSTTEPDKVGNLVINVDDIIYNPGVPQLMDDVSRLGADRPVRKLHVRKRKRELSPDPVPILNEVRDPPPVQTMTSKSVGSSSSRSNASSISDSNGKMSSVESVNSERLYRGVSEGKLSKENASDITNIREIVISDTSSSLTSLDSVGSSVGDDDEIYQDPSSEKFKGDSTDEGGPVQESISVPQAGTHNISVPASGQIKSGRKAAPRKLNAQVASGRRTSGRGLVAAVDDGVADEITVGIGAISGV